MYTVFYVFFVDNEWLDVPVCVFVCWCLSVGVECWCSSEFLVMRDKKVEPS